MADQQSMTPESLFEMRWVSGPQLAPDGERVAYVEHWVEEIEKDGNRRPAYRTAIYLSANADQPPRRLSYAPSGNDSMPRWSPDGRAIAFLSTRDGDVAQLWTLDLDGGEAQPVTATASLSEGVSAFDWHPSGTMFCVLTAGHRTEDDKRHDVLHDEKVYEDRLPIKFDNVGFYKPYREQLYRVGRDGGERVQLTQHDRGISQPVWSPDGRSIAFVSQTTGTPEWTFTSDVLVVGIDGGELRPVTRTLGPVSYPAWSPDGLRIAFYGHDKRRGNASTDRLWVADVQSGDVRCLTEGFEGSAGDIANGDAHLGAKLYYPRWDEQDRLTILALVEGRAGLYRVSAAGDGVEQINTSGLSVTGFSQRGDTIAFTGETNTRSAEVYVSRSGHKLERRSHAADEFFGKYRLQTIDHLPFKGADDWDLEGWAIKPLDAQPGTRYPVLIYVHGGPHTAYGNGFFHEFQVLAAAGFGVVFVNPRGSSSYGEDFADAVRRHFGEGDYEDIMRAADLAATWDWVDEQRMGIVGGSYGGFMTNWVITHTDRFAAACTQRSICNLLSFAGTSDIGPEFSEEEYGALPWTDRDVLIAKSPISYVQNVKTPTLILHQEEDHRCPIEQAEQLYTALVVLGVPTKLVRFPNEGHELSRSGQPQRRVNRMHHIIDWFGRYLQS